MKVAIIHDYIKEYGGAERVLESLHAVFPEATVFTSVYLPEFLGPHRSRFEGWNIKTSFMQSLPLKEKLISPMRVVSPFLFGYFDFKDFDVIIVSATGAYSPNSIRKGSAKQISYVHTPPRYLYGYETARNWKNNPITHLVGSIIIPPLRSLDVSSSTNVDYFIANSEETKKRIEKFYKKYAVVIYPPVSVSSPKVERGDYFLAGGRIARAKHTDLIVDAFIRNGLPLKVFGKGFAGFEEEVRKKAKPYSNIEFVGEVEDAERDRLMAGAKAFIFASEDEDFGIVPVEAMMLGAPVIAHKSGGVLETIVDGKTGLFFDDFTTESLNSAIEKLQKTKFDYVSIKAHAKKFGKERFEKEIKEFVDKVVG